ncbi:hypothetical protein F4808DRAFT_382282 [Astrocystis sublimbata]|nr:hypothetical protein F4808DRAFT_382282 [Astrocystis sublimbata]
MSSNWHFIATDQVGGKVAVNNRKTVREAAMRAYRRNQRLQRQKHDQRSPKQLQPALASQADAGTGQLTLLPVTGRLNKNPKANTSRSNPISTIEKVSGLLAFDPFSTTPLHSRHEGHMLFAHFIYNIVPTIQAFRHHSPQNPLSTILVNYAITDPLFAQGILFHAAVHLDISHGRPWGHTTWRHRGLLIHKISKRLNSSQDTASDALILGIALLGASGNLTGDVTQDSVHRQALHHMIRARGGVDKLGCQGTLSTFISM